MSIYRNTLLLGENKLKNHSLLLKSIDGKILGTTLLKVQEEKLKPILGMDFYKFVQSEVFKMITESHELSDDTKELLHEYIQPYLINAVTAECIDTLEYRLTNKGVKKLTDSNATALGTQELHNIRKKLELAAVSYKSDLIHYLKANDLAKGMLDDDIVFVATGWYFPSTTCNSMKGYAKGSDWSGGGTKYTGPISILINDGGGNIWVDSNLPFVIADDVSLENNSIALYLNGQRLVRGTDFDLSERNIVIINPSELVLDENDLLEVLIF